MGNFLPTALLAIGIMGLVILGLAVGLLVTGRPRLHHGCGKKAGGSSHCCRSRGDSTSCDSPDGHRACEKKKEAPSDHD